MIKVCGESCKYGFVHSDLLYHMDENGLFQASTALPPWKERPVPIEEGAGWVWLFWGVGKFLTPAGNRSTFPRLSVSSVVYTDYATSGRVCVCDFIYAMFWRSIHAHTQT